MLNKRLSQPVRNKLLSITRKADKESYSKSTFLARVKIPYFIR
jgi:hypothetical protein